MTAPFIWATVGLDAIDHVATEAGLTVISTRSVGTRHTATLRRAVL